jgi:hypothetical protein
MSEPVAGASALDDAVEAFYTAMRNYDGHPIGCGRYVDDHGSAGWIDDGVTVVVEALLAAGWIPPREL